MNENKASRPDAEMEAEKKKAIFDMMAPRRQQHILKRGYEKWDPFEAPKDPIDIRTDKTKRTTQTLVREFLQTHPSERYGNAYARGVFDFCLGIVNDDERYIGMYEFACWYQELKRKEGVE
jgi:hypothetical protein